MNLLKRNRDAVSYYFLIVLTLGEDTIKPTAGTCGLMQRSNRGEMAGQFSDFYNSLDADPAKRGSIARLELEGLVS